MHRKIQMFQIKQNDENKPNNKVNKTDSDANKNSENKSAQAKLKKEFIWSDTYQKGNDNPHFPFTSRFFTLDKINVGPFEFDQNFISN